MLSFRVIRGAVLTVAFATACLAGGAARADTPGVDWGSGTLTEDQLWALIVQMTVAEEDSFIHGATIPCDDVYVSPWVYGCVGEAGRIPGVVRLGIPPLRLSDGPAGVRLGHQETAMPAPVGLSACFDRGLSHLFGAIVGRGLRASNQDVWLGPMMNMVSVPTAGRNFETLGEDPYLSGEMAAQLTLGSQSEGIIATIKHYVDNDFENGRTDTNVLIDEQTQREMQLQPFEKAAMAGAGAAMCSYNRINGVYGCGNDIVQKQILKGELGWGGFIMSDWGATHTPQDLIHGLDMEQWLSDNLGDPVIDAIISGSGTAAVDVTNDMPAEQAYTALEWKTALDNAVFRILKQMNNISLLEGTQYGAQSNGCAPAAAVDCAPYVPPRPDLQTIQPEEFAAAQTIAETSATLLKNDGAALPLTSADLAGSGILVMGPTATTAYVGGGGSAHVVPYDPVISPYQALVAAAGPNANISYVPGYDLDGDLVPSSLLTAPDTANPYIYWTLKPEDAAFNNQPGLLRQQITTDPASGSQPALYTGADATPDQLDALIDYTGAATLPVNTGWRWTGLLTAPATGSTQLKIFVANQASSQLFVDGLNTFNARRIDIGAYPSFPNNSYASLGQTAKSHDPAAPGLQQATYTANFTAGQQIHLDLRLITGAITPAQIQLRWVPTDSQSQAIDAAVAAAAAANKVVIFAYDDGTEAADRGGNAIANGLALSGYQDALIEAVVAANPNTIIVLNTGSPVFMPWASSVKSILEIWYPGQMGGPATANVLLGKVNPAGKLPVTFPDGAAPIGQRFPQDAQPAPCADNTAGALYYGYGPAGYPGNCPLYPGVYAPGFLGDDLHSFRTINYTDGVFAGVLGNGIFQGYRWFDKHGYTPLFPFGHGLSYTSFEYRDLVLTPQGTAMRVSFFVQNTGAVTGVVVPQVYVGPAPNVPSYAQQADRALRGFDRVELRPSEAKQIEITLDRRSFQYWDEQTHRWTMAPGVRTIWVGDSSRDLRLSGVSELSAAFACDDGVDNDGDGFIDYPDDPGCPFSDATIENPQCDDGVDNDGNGFTDFADSKCQPSWPYWETPPCGLGAELALVLPLISLAASRRRRANWSDPAPA
jgi:beta-glucosidase